MPMMREIECAHCDELFDIEVSARELVDNDIAAEVCPHCWRLNDISVTIRVHASVSEEA